MIKSKNRSEDTMRQTTHKLLSTAAAVCLIFGTTTSVFAQSDFSGNLNTVSISDAAKTNSPPTANFTYTQDGDTFYFDASGSSDADGSITDYKWDFGNDTTGTDISTSTQFVPGIHTVTLTVIDNSGGITITQSTVSYSTGPDYSINFQPDSVTIPTGFQVDSGNAFNPTQGFGWKTGPSSFGPRDRDNPSSPDQTYDTMIHVKPTSIWELAVPNGNYSITICVGDPSYPSGNQNLQVEGQILIDNVELPNFPQWYEKTATVSVKDNNLSITFTGSTDPARLCWLTVTSIN